MPVAPTYDAELLTIAARDAANKLKEFQNGDPNRHSADLAHAALIAAVAAAGALADAPFDDPDMNDARRDVGIMYDEARLALARIRAASTKQAYEVAAAARRDRIAARRDRIAETRARRAADKKVYEAAKAAHQ